MPIKCISVPSPITLIDPLTKKPLLLDELDPETKQPKPAPPITMREFVSKLLLNPVWSENYQNLKSARAIDAAFSAEGDKVQLAEDDWRRLRDLAENPKQGGYGYHPAVMPQLLPFIEAIIEAKDFGK